MARIISPLHECLVEWAPAIAYVAIALAGIAGLVWCMHSDHERRKAECVRTGRVVVQHADTWTCEVKWP